LNFFPFFCFDGAKGMGEKGEEKDAVGERTEESWGFAATL
jgi:hypothetical protein